MMTMMRKIVQKNATTVTRALGDVLCECVVFVLHPNLWADIMNGIKAVVLYIISYLQIYQRTKKNVNLNWGSTLHKIYIYTVAIGGSNGGNSANNDGGGNDYSRIAIAITYHHNRQQNIRDKHIYCVCVCIYICASAKMPSMWWRSLVRDEMGNEFMICNVDDGSQHGFFLRIYQFSR